MNINICKAGKEDRDMEIHKILINLKSYRMVMEQIKNSPKLDQMKKMINIIKILWIISYKRKINLNKKSNFKSKILQQVSVILFRKYIFINNKFYL